jgi:hypothetical protein
MMRLATGRLVVGSGLAMLVFMALLLPRAASRPTRSETGVGMPDTTFFYTPDHVFSYAKAQGQDGRQQYVRDRLTLDTLFPPSYGLFFVSATALGLRRAFPHRRRLSQLGWVGVAAMVADLCENVLVSAILLAYPNRLGAVSWLAAAASGIKWSLVFPGMALALFALAAWGWSAWRRRRQFT